MKIAHYIGKHAGDTRMVRAGWAATRVVQRGKYRRVTHCEAILAGDARSATIASSSIRDGGCVRAKAGVVLDPMNWLISDVTPWPVELAREWFAAHDGEPYDLLGAAGSAIPFLGHTHGWWHCNAAVGASGGLVSPYIFGPAQFAAICFSLGRDVTAEFFKSQEGQTT